MLLTNANTCVSIMVTYLLARGVVYMGNGVSSAFILNGDIDDDCKKLTNKINLH